MTIGKRKGAAAKGTGAAPGNVANSKYGGSLSKNDHWYLHQAFGMVGDPGLSGAMEATGGIIGEYVDPGPGAVYRTHTFTASGSFVVSDIGSRDPSSANLDYLIIAGGGGGGGAYEAGGGGAGGYRATTPEGPGGPSPTAESKYGAAVGTYTVTIGAGGAGGDDAPQNTLAIGNDGSATAFFPAPVSSPDPTYMSSVGGGGGGTYMSPSPPATIVLGRPGGSGGGAANTHPGTTGPFAGGEGTANQGYDGGTRGNQPHAPLHNGSGGGGAGSVGASNTGNTIGESAGGDGKASTITGTSIFRAGGGGGGTWKPGGGAPPTGTGGAAGSGGGGVGGNGPPSGGAYSDATAATAATGSGGGGSGGNTGFGGAGGPGIVVLRYPIASSTGTAKASGGDISFYNSKVIHTFVTSGTFTTDAGFNETCEVVIIGGGGGGGEDQGGAGGAGCWQEKSIAINTPTATPMAITVGGGGRSGYIPRSAGIEGTSSAGVFPPGTVTAGGGGGGGYLNNNAPGPHTGSGGGAGGPNDGGGGRTAGATSADPFPGTPGVSPANGWGFPGGTGSPADNTGGGGGGGAGGEGSNGAPTGGGTGGLGVQLPTTFHNPESTVGYPGPGPSSYWFAGGGGGAGLGGPPNGGEGGGSGAPYDKGSGDWAGAGKGGTQPTTAGSGGVNSGSGGGGQQPPASTGPTGFDAGRGGSGIVLIAYPS